MMPFRSIASGLRGLFVPPAPAEKNLPLRAVNVTRGTVLATQLEVADTGPSRNKGLLGRKNLAPGEALWIVPCESVHTFFMRFPIDLIYLDRKNRIRKVRSDVGAWRMSACFSAHSVIELRAGTIRETMTQRGDLVKFEPAVLGDSAA